MAPVLSPSQIATALRRAGFPESELPRMTAAALAESGGNPRAHNPNAQTGDNSYGLWQINMLGGMGPERRRQFGLKSNEDLFDPTTNARAAKGIFDSQGPNAWSVIRSGAYKKHLAEAERAVSNPGEALPAATPPALTQGPAPSGTDDFAQNILKGLLGGGATASARRPQQDFDPMAALGLRSGGLLAPVDGADGLRLLPVPSRGKSAPPELIGGGGMFDYLSRTLGGGAPREAMSNGAPLAGGGMFAGLMKAILSPKVDTQPTSMPASMPAQQMALSGRSKGIVDIGKMLQDSAGLRVREHPEFGGVGGHSDGSLHYKGLALDVTDWQDPGESEKSWLPRKKWTAEQWQKTLGSRAEVFGPHNDPRGHGTHIHLGLPSGSLPEEIAQQLVQVRKQALEKYPLRWND